LKHYRNRNGNHRGAETQRYAEKNEIWAQPRAVLPVISRMFSANLRASAPLRFRVRG
jgi:hypothetical protein